MNKCKIILILAAVLVCLANSGIHAQTVKDADGNVYTSTSIGNQIWLVENLKTTRFNDGTPIPYVPDEKKWSELKSPGFCWLKNDIKNKESRGALYNWYTVGTKKLCPKGWHVPTNDEWTAMTIFLGEKESAGDKLKSTEKGFWDYPMCHPSNDFDFSAVPSGIRLVSGVFPLFADGRAVWWSSTGNDNDAWNRGLSFDSGRVFKGDENLRYGFAVRCIKD
jgi:uncharacterized protein (TIGR02145 family)